MEVYRAMDDVIIRLKARDQQQLHDDLVDLLNARDTSANPGSVHLVESLLAQLHQMAVL